MQSINYKDCTGIHQVDVAIGKKKPPPKPVRQMQLSWKLVINNSNMENNARGCNSCHKTV